MIKDMRKYFPFVLDNSNAMKTTITLLCVILTLSATAQLQKPTWEMPIYFTNGDGSRDTVYLGVDSLATNNFDSLFEDNNSVADSGEFAAYITGSRVDNASWGKRNVGSPAAEGFIFGIFLYNVDVGFAVTVDLQNLADTTHGIKNVVWDEQSQSFVPDKYKGAQLWLDMTQSNPTDFHSNHCGLWHGGEILAFVGGSPELPAMKGYPVCYEVENRMEIFTWRPSGKKFSAILYFELKPMNILGSPLVGIEEMQDLDVSLYPNPVTGEFHIDNQESEPLHVVIYNYLAREVKRLELSPFEILQTDLSDLPSGMYLVELRNTKNSAFKKVLKG